MNTIYSERKKRAQETKAEIDRLRAELAEKDNEIERMHDETVMVDSDRVWELEQQVQALKKELADRGSGGQRQRQPQLGLDSSPAGAAYNWTLAARDPFADEYSDMDLDEGLPEHEDDDDNMFGNNTMAELACSTPSRRARNAEDDAYVRASASFPTPPATSPNLPAISLPTVPVTPSSRFRLELPTPLSHVGVQSDLPDPEKEKLEEELSSLQLEVCKLTTKLESYASMTARLSEKLAPFPRWENDTPPEQSPRENASASESSPIPELESRLANALRTLSDRTTALLEVNTSLSSLGFPGSDGLEIISSLSRALRTARLELEYLTPGEITLPLTSAGAQVLDLLLTQLRDLAKHKKESDQAIDEYHSIELNLRQQLGARVDAFDALFKQSLQKDVQIKDLEVGLERLKGVVKGYERDLAELESLVNRMETELVAADKERQANADKLKESSEKHDTEISQLKSEASREKKEMKALHESEMEDLEVKLAAKIKQTEWLQAQLERLARENGEAKAHHKMDTIKLNIQHGRQLALRDARVMELRGEVDRVNASLRAAHETILRLRVENGKLEKEKETLEVDKEELGAKARGDRRKAKEVMDEMKAELERVVKRMGEGMLQQQLATPKKRKVRSLARRDSVVGGGHGEEDERVDDDDGEDELGAGLLQPLSPSPTSSPSKGSSGSLLVGDLTRRSSGRGKKRRRYDSGLGFLDEEEVDRVDV